MKWVDYRERLGIGFSDMKKAKLLSNNVSTFIENSSINADYTIDDYYRFCLMVGIKYEQPFNPTEYLAFLFERDNISIPQILSYYIAFVNTKKEQKRKHRESLIRVMCDFLTELNISYEIFKDDDGFFIFPKGVPEFDDALVSSTLTWLKQYPNSEKAWSKAMRDYSEANEENASDVADKFRKALETLFQEFFGGGKSLENYKSEYGAFLKCKGIPKEISSNFETLLQSYTNYMNNYAKHRDATSDKVLEYLMYQTGNIMRLLITLKQEATNNAD